ncbi:hypothetical protein OGAPHI_004245 [Ogataea philodendri]|uniref:Uncharacterized protein n=1 Tax=Ogataea philodendri TaxID=1378263 RepID=A0A9P8P6R0_9ASCO|nr:uncharacterized protein OGAPHI_004245 [Ogataea philodendri]KAH3666056.1 hypothetical protein OGAPHI_004245 [Ogataea philodendri]
MMDPVPSLQPLPIDTRFPILQFESTWVPIWLESHILHLLIVFGLVFLDLFQTRGQISSSWVNHLGFHDKLPSNKNHDIQEQNQVVVQEGVNVELRNESENTQESYHNEHANSTVDCRIWLPFGQNALQWQSTSVQSLGLACSVESEINNHHVEVVDELRSSGEVDQPIKHSRSSTIKLQQRQTSEGSGNNKTHKWHTVTGCVSEDFQRQPSLSQSKKRSGTAVHVRVSCREGRQHTQNVHNVWQHFDTHVLHRDNIRGNVGSRSSLSNSVSKLWIVVIQNNTNTQSTSDEEEQQSEHDGLECRHHGLSWVLCLSCHHSQVFWGSHRENGFTVSRPESTGTCSEIFWECVLITSEISETVSVMLRVSSQHGDESVEHQTSSQDNFSR